MEWKSVLTRFIVNNKVGQFCFSTIAYVLTYKICEMKIYLDLPTKIEMNLKWVISYVMGTTYKPKAQGGMGTAAIDWYITPAPAENMWKLKFNRILTFQSGHTIFVSWCVTHAHFVQRMIDRIQNHTVLFKIRLYCAKSNCAIQNQIGLFKIKLCYSNSRDIKCVLEQ